MNHKERAVLREMFNDMYCEPVMASKGVEYSNGSGGEEEANANFYLIEQLLRGAPMDAHTAMVIYFMKHFAWLCQYTVNRKEGTEGLLSRVADMRNYLDIIVTEYMTNQPKEVEVEETTVEVDCNDCARFAPGANCCR